MKKILDSAGVVNLVSDIKTLADATYAQMDQVEDLFEIKTESGSIASFTPILDTAAINELNVELEPIQDLNGYDKPWPSGGGVNQYPAGQTVNTIADGSLTVTKTDTTLNGYDATRVEISGTTESWGWRFYYGGIRDLLSPSTSYRFTFLANAQFSCNLQVSDTNSSNKLVTALIFTSRSVSSGLYEYSCEFTTYASDDAGWQGTSQIAMIIPIPNTLSPADITFVNDPCLTLSTDPEGYFPYSNICPISGRTGCNIYRTGKNLVDAIMPSASKYDITCTNNGDGSFTLNGNNTSGHTADFRIDQSQYQGSDRLKTYKAGTYKASGLESGVRLMVMQNSTWLQVMDFTSDNDTVTLANDVDNCFIFLAVRSGISLSNVTVKPQIEIGSTATEWAPYAGDIYNFNWTSSAGTVYGGTMDAISGLFTVKWKKISLGDYTIDKLSDGRFYTSYVTDFKINYSDSGNVKYGNGVCNAFDFMANNDWQTINNACTCFYNTDYSGYRIFIHSVEHENDTGPEFKAYLQSIGAEFAYELATPVTYQLTPHEVEVLLNSVNHIWSDSGDVEVKYSEVGRAYADSIAEATKRDYAPISTGVRENLLDNWYFVGGGTGTYGTFPVNQRGQASYSSNNTYSIDRWKIGTSAEITVQSDSLKIKSTSNTAGWRLNQTISNCGNLVGVEMTFSVLISSHVGTKMNFSATFLNSSNQQISYLAISGSKNGVVSISGIVPVNTSTILFGLYGNTGVAADDYVVIKAAKMEFGSTQTLAHLENGVWVINEIPDYREQLYRCITSHADSDDTYANYSPTPYSSTKTISTFPYSILPIDSGRTLMPAWSVHGTSVTMNLTQVNSTEMPIGTEIALFNVYLSTIVIATDGVRTAVNGEQGDSNGLYSVSAHQFNVGTPNTMVALKKLFADSTNGDIWLLTGNVEVVS